MTDAERLENAVECLAIVNRWLATHHLISVVKTTDGIFRAIVSIDGCETALSGWTLVNHLQRLQHEVMESLRTPEELS